MGNKQPVMIFENYSGNKNCRRKIKGYSEEKRIMLKEVTKNCKAITVPRKKKIGAITTK